MIASTGDVFRVNFYHRGRKEEGGGKRMEEEGGGGRDFLFSRTFCFTLSSVFFDLYREEPKKRKSAKKKRAKKKTENTGGDVLS